MWKGRLEPWKVAWTLDNWRWACQEALTISIAALPSRFGVVDDIFDGNSRWIVPAACAAIDKTAGASTIRMIDRLAGTILAAFYVALCFMATVGATPLKDPLHSAIIAIYWLLGALAGFLCGWLGFKWPRHPAMSVAAVSTVPVLMGSLLSGEHPLSRCLWRAVCFSFGVLVSGSVTRWFLPRRARTDIIKALVRILNELASALEPLLELESGFIVSTSLFEPTPGKTQVNLPAWKAFKKQIWAQLENCGRQISAHLALTFAARREISWRHHGFQEEAYQNCLLKTRTLFYHVTSLFTLIESQMDFSSTVGGPDPMEGKIDWSRYGMIIVNAEGKHRRQSIESCDSSDAGPNEDVTVLVKGTEETPRLKFRPHTPSERYAERYAPTIGFVIRHICAALRHTAEGLNETQILPSVTWNMTAAGRAISHFHRQREERRQAPAVYVDYVLGKKTDFAKLERSLGVKFSDYREYNADQQRDHWDAYWALRDRLSALSNTVITLFVAVSQAIAATEALIRSRMQKIELGESIIQSVDADRLELEQQIAITQAGGQATRYRVDQLN